jgi:hypothetical protein
MKIALIVSKEVGLQINAEKNTIYFHVIRKECRTKLVQERNKWRALVNTSMNLGAA